MGMITRHARKYTRKVPANPKGTVRNPCVSAFEITFAGDKKNEQIPGMSKYIRISMYETNTTILMIPRFSIPRFSGAIDPITVPRPGRSMALSANPARARALHAVGSISIGWLHSFLQGSFMAFSFLLRRTGYQGHIPSSSEDSASFTVDITMNRFPTLNWVQP